MRAEPGLTLTVHTAEPRSPSDEALGLLGSWAATGKAEERVRKTGAPAGPLGTD
ncbi:hypothetical protein [Yinghuangia sp. YIM S10712]|uniref:hypothetical protein n=1 Tax=Yinghuangia sp. YIM S10712 TaxID=3436930 RepID=UPI003F534FB3